MNIVKYKVFKKSWRTRLVKSPWKQTFQAALNYKKKKKKIRLAYPMWKRRQIATVFEEIESKPDEKYMTWVIIKSYDFIK